jgi:glycoside/pentoside/hexuronide:cation symporter, GPH family
MFLFCFSSIKERVVSIKANDSLRKDLKDIIKNDQWLLMISITFLNVFPAFIRGAVTIYYATYVMKASVDLLPSLWPSVWPVICWAASLLNR